MRLPTSGPRSETWSRRFWLRAKTCTESLLLPAWGGLSHPRTPIRIGPGWNGCRTRRYGRGWSRRRAAPSPFTCDADDMARRSPGGSALTPLPAGAGLLSSPLPWRERVALSLSKGRVRGPTDRLEGRRHNGHLTSFKGGSGKWGAEQEPYAAKGGLSKRRSIGSIERSGLPSISRRVNSNKARSCRVICCAMASPSDGAVFSCFSK